MTVRHVLEMGGLLCAMFFAVAIIGSCRARYRDVSHERRYAERVGQRCTVLKGLIAHGVTWDSRNEDPTEWVTVTPPPGFGGREVTFEVDVPKGTEIWITSVQECLNCPFGRTRYSVTIPDLRKLNPYPIFTREESLAADQVQCVKESTGK